VSEILRARESFHYTNGAGVPSFVAVDALVTSDDPVVKGRQHLFEPVAVSADRRAAAGVEDMSAEPGELRSVSTVKRGRGRKPETPEPEPEATPEATPAVEE
jgi:hypothetical protein